MAWRFNSKGPIHLRDMSRDMVTVKKNILKIRRLWSSKQRSSLLGLKELFHTERKRDIFRKGWVKVGGEGIVQWVGQGTLFPASNMVP